MQMVSLTEVFGQSKQQEVDTYDDAITEVSVDMDTNGNIEENLTVESMYGVDAMSTGTYAMIGEPFNFRQHRIYNNQKKRKQGKIRKRSAMFIFRPQGTLNQAVTENLSARYRFANANMIFSLAVCFRRPRYRVFRYWNSFLTIAKTCSTLHLTDDFSCSFFLA